MTIYVFSQLVLNWYHNNGRKNLPWQKNKTLYKVWISEIMLQQTTVKSVIPYFKKFILNFPDIESLNNSTLDEILHLWSGLGYYSRARNIYKSVEIIKKKHKGMFPSQFLDIIKLPGIGRSTAGAILSLSLNFFYPILDGNVKRILIRYYGIIGAVQDKKIERQLWNMIELVTPLHNAGKFNQSMMDIGSSICKSIKPKCNICPLNERCIAQKEQKWEKYPLKNKKKICLTRISWFIVIKCKHYLWLEKNIKKEIWKNLFCFPQFNTELKAFNWLVKKEINTKKYKKIKPFFHKFSHFILHIHPIVITLPNTSILYEKENKSLWYNLIIPQYIGLPKPVEKIIGILKKIFF